MDNYEIAFQIILRAGNSKSFSMIAMQNAREGDFETATENLKMADDELNEAHAIQTDLIQKEAAGDARDLNLIMIHAQDHLTSAMIIKDLAAEIRIVYTRISNLERR